MSNEKTAVEKLIGNTPLVELTNLANRFQFKSHIYAKLESFNPGGSAKDRPALKMIREAEESGRLKENGVIIEPTSGNTGIGLASIAAARGYQTIIVMPDTMSMERRKIMKAYGAYLVLTDGKLGMKGAIARAEELAKKIPNSIIAGQFENPANPRAHYETTGPEIQAALDTPIDYFISAVGTGGTLTGTGRYLKERYPDLTILAVEPAGSPVLSKGRAGKHKIQGIGAGFIPKALDTTLIDQVLPIEDDTAFEICRFLGTEEGILAGISSGAALAAAISIAVADRNDEKTLVVVLPDTGERYLSTDLWDGEPTPEEEIEALCSLKTETDEENEESREAPPKEPPTLPENEPTEEQRFQTNTTEGMDFSIILDTKISKPMGIATEKDYGVVISLDTGGAFTFQMSLSLDGPRFFSNFEQIDSIGAGAQERIKQLSEEEIGVHIPIFGQVEPHPFLHPNPPKKKEGEEEDLSSQLIGEVFWEKEAIARYFQISPEELDEKTLAAAKKIALSTIWRYNKVLTNQIVVINVCRKEKDSWKKIGHSDSIYSTLWTSPRGDSDIRNFLIGIFDIFWGDRLYNKIALIHPEDMEEIEHLRRVNAYWN